MFPSEQINKSPREQVLVEKSINSVRISIKVKKMDELDGLLCHKFARFMVQRAESFVILRKKPIKVHHIKLVYAQSCFRIMISLFLLLINIYRFS